MRLQPRWGDSAPLTRDCAVFSSNFKLICLLALSLLLRFARDDGFTSAVGVRSKRLA